MTQYAFIRGPYLEIVKFLFNENEGAIKCFFSSNKYKKKSDKPHEKQIEFDFTRSNLFVKSAEERARLETIWKEYSAADAYCQGLMGATIISELFPQMNSERLPFFAKIPPGDLEESLKNSEGKSNIDFHFACKGRGDNANAVAMVSREGCPENFMLFVIRNAQSAVKNGEVCMITSACMFSEVTLDNEAFPPGIRCELKSSVSAITLQKMVNDPELANVLAFLFPGEGFCSIAGVKYIQNINVSPGSSKARLLLDAEDKGRNSYQYNILELQHELAEVTCSSLQQIDMIMACKQAAAKLMRSSPIFIRLRQSLRECLQDIDDKDVAGKDLLLLDTLCSEATWLAADRESMTPYESRQSLNAMGRLGALIIYFTDYAQKKITTSPHITYLLLVLVDVLKRCLPWYVNIKSELETELCFNKDPTVGEVDIEKVQQIFTALKNQKKLVCSQRVVRQFIEIPFYLSLSKEKLDSLKRQQETLRQLHQALVPFRDVCNVPSRLDLAKSWQALYEEALDPLNQEDYYQALLKVKENFSGLDKITAAKERWKFFNDRHEEFIKIEIPAEKYPLVLKNRLSILKAICEITYLQTITVDLEAALNKQKKYLELAVHCIESITCSCKEVADSQSPQAVNALVCEFFCFNETLKDLHRKEDEVIKRYAEIVTASSTLRAEYANLNNQMAVLACHFKNKDYRQTICDEKASQLSLSAETLPKEVSASLLALKDLQNCLQAALPWQLDSQDYLDSRGSLLAVTFNPVIRSFHALTRDRANSSSDFFAKVGQKDDISSKEVKGKPQQPRSTSI